MRLEPEELLRHTGWMTALARGLVLDEGRAQDVVQQAFVEILERAPERPRSTAAWLGTVVRNLARRDHRSSARRIRRETAAARRESTTPIDVVERVELHRLVVDRVLALPEPYREAVLLRYFEDLSVAGVAERQGVPLPTARSRLQRSLDRLRRELDRVHGGDRARWLPAVAMLAGLEAVAVSSPASAAAGTSIGTTSSPAALAGTVPAGLKTFALGGVIVTSKSVMTIAALNVAILFLGGAIGRYLTQMSPEEAKARFELIEAEKLAGLESRFTELQAAFEAAEADRRRLESEKDGLAARVESLASELEGERKKGETTPGLQRKLGLAFGSFAELEALANADWREIAGAIKALNGLFLEVLEAQQKGEPLSPELQQRLAEENGKLMHFYTGLMGKLPTHAVWSGEYTHPLVLANLFGAVLDESGLPLTSAQKAAVERAGGGFDAAYDQLQKAYTADTPLLEKMADELALKEDYTRRFHELLSSEQLDVVLPPELRNRTQYNLLSPAAATLSAQTTEYTSAEDARSRFQQKLLQDIGIDPAMASTFDTSFAAWQEELASLLVPRTAADGPPTFEHMLLAAKAEAALLKQLLATPGLSEKMRAAIIARQAWTVPYVTAKTP
jgi:RNA polymerase sigma-70 factor (ECF subfamily)